MPKVQEKTYWYVVNDTGAVLMKADNFDQAMNFAKIKASIGSNDKLTMYRRIEAIEEKPKPIKKIKNMMPDNMFPDEEEKK